MIDERLDSILVNLDELPNDYWRAEIRQLINDYREKRDHIHLLEKEGRRYRQSIARYRQAIWRLVEEIEDGFLKFPEGPKALADEAKRARKLYREGQA